MTKTVQNILVLFQDTPALDARVFGWSRYFASEPEVTVEDEETPPYANAMDAMRDGWRVIQMSEIKVRSDEQLYRVGAFPYQTVLEKLVEVEA